MRITLWGTRGSQPSPGPDTLRYGGNTSCVEFQTTVDTRLVLDAGTGLRVAGTELPAEVRRVDLMLTHLHMDHIQGLGFFEPLFRPGFEVHIWGPGSATADLQARLTRYISPPLFPVRLSELPCDLHLHDLHDGSVDVPGFHVRTALVCHPGPTVGYRVEDHTGSVAYLPDHEPALACRRFAESPEWCSGLDLAAGVDLLLHDAQYSDAEYQQRIGWGHSSFDQASAFARLAKVRWFMPFHHDPAHDDDRLDEFFGDSGDQAFRLLPAREGMVVELVDLIDA